MLSTHTRVDPATHTAPNTTGGRADLSVDNFLLVDPANPQDWLGMSFDDYVALNPQNFQGDPEQARGTFEGEFNQPPPGGWHTETLFGLEAWEFGLLSVTLPFAVAGGAALWAGGAGGAGAGVTAASTPLPASVLPAIPAAPSAATLQAQTLASIFGAPSPVAFGLTGGELIGAAGLAYGIYADQQGRGDAQDLAESQQAFAEQQAEANRQFSIQMAELQQANAMELIRLRDELYNNSTGGSGSGDSSGPTLNPAPSVFS